MHGLFAERSQCDIGLKQGNQLLVAQPVLSRALSAGGTLCNIVHEGRRTLYAWWKSVLEVAVPRTAAQAEQKLAMDKG